MTKAYGWGVRVNRKEYFKLRLQNCSLINQNTMSLFYAHALHNRILPPPTPFWGDEKGGGGHALYSVFLNMLLLTLEIEK